MCCVRVRKQAYHPRKLLDSKFRLVQTLCVMPAIFTHTPRVHACSNASVHVHVQRKVRVYFAGVCGTSVPLSVTVHAMRSILIYGQSVYGVTPFSNARGNGKVRVRFQYKSHRKRGNKLKLMYVGDCAQTFCSKVMASFVLPPNVERHHAH